MKITDCTWELTNLGEKTVEIEIEPGDSLTSDLLQSYCKENNYIVVKVPVNMIPVNIVLANEGFTLMESQLTITQNYKSFDFDNKLIKFLYDDIDFADITTIEDFENMISNITPHMFSTDRIYLDPAFGPEMSMKRYVNWMRTSFQNGSMDFYEYIYHGERVGFTMYKKDGNTWHGILGGVYEKYQNEGIGMLTASSFFLYAKKRNLPLKKLIGAISSNNTPVVTIYNYLNFKLISDKYVFVKHIHK